MPADLFVPVLMKRPVVVVLHGDRQPIGMAVIEAVAEVRYTQASGLADALTGADVLFLWDFFSCALKDVWHCAESLKWIHVAAAGVDKLLFDELVASTVQITNSRGVFDRPIAEFVLASILAVRKDIPGSLRRQQHKVWEHRETDLIVGSKALIVGTGAIGRECARLLRAVGIQVAGAGRSARIDDPDFDVVHASTDLVQVVADADHVVLIAPLTNATRGLADAAVFQAMKRTAQLINVGRGELVDEQALIGALRSGLIASAALDVFSVEPLPAASPLWEMDNVLISAHLSGDAAGWLTRLLRLFIENFERYVRGEELRNIVDKQLGFVVSSASR